MRLYLTAPRCPHTVLEQWLPPLPGHGWALWLAQANILQPLTHLGTLNLRHEAVEELLGSEEMHVDIAQALQALPRDLDKVCRGLVSTHACARNNNRPATAGFMGVLTGPENGCPFLCVTAYTSCVQPV